MRKNLPDRKLTKREMKELEKHHYEKPDHICSCGCGYHKNTCMRKIQEDFQNEKKGKSISETTIPDCNPCTCGGFIQNCPKLIISI